jgi:hypothetical protein
MAEQTTRVGLRRISTLEAVLRIDHQDQDLATFVLRP